MSPKTLTGTLVLASLVVGSAGVVAADNDKAAQISAKSQAALTSLYEKVPSTRILGDKAVAILVFPEITKAGFIVGGQHGNGTLFKNRMPVAYYKTTGASVGLQAGAQTYGYAMFFMTDKALQQLDAADGFEIGVGPTVVVLDEGKAANITTTTMKDDIYAFVFGQKGLMAGIGIQGNKISRNDPD
jgi:lipid-binding SYLF domain-containing protein